MEIGIGDKREGAIAVNVELIVSGGGVSRRLLMFDNNATAHRGGGVRKSRPIMSDNKSHGEVVRKVKQMAAADPFEFAFCFLRSNMRAVRL